MESYETTNINSLWLNNIYDNLKSLEIMERTAREGCTSLMEYLQLPLTQRNIIVADAQYKNLRFMVTEMQLLLTDLTPVVKKESHDNFMETLRKITPAINKRDLFVNDLYSVTKNAIISSEVTPFFHDTLKFLSDLKLNIIREIAHILYISEDSGRNKPKW